MSSRRLLAPLALLALVPACEDASPGGTRGGVRIGSERERDIAYSICKLQARCGGYPESWNPDGECIFIVRDMFGLREPGSDACVDARLDYLSCLGQRHCAELRQGGTVLVWQSDLEPCEEWAERRDGLCE